MDLSLPHFWRMCLHLASPPPHSPCSLLVGLRLITSSLPSLCLLTALTHSSFLSVLSFKGILQLSSPSLNNYFTVSNFLFDSATEFWLNNYKLYVTVFQNNLIVLFAYFREEISFIILGSHWFSLSIVHFINLLSECWELNPRAPPMPNKRSTIEL